MSAPERIDRGDQAADDRELFERVGYARAGVDGAEQTLAAHRARREELVRQNEVVVAECQQLERELLQKLSAWRKLDDQTQNVETQVQQFRAVTGSFTYRLVVALLRGINRVRNLVTFGGRRA
jgi:hypothetical protein